MRPNPLLIALAMLYGAAGLALTFAPGEIAAAAGATPDRGSAWFAQALGAALLGLAWLNWLHRTTATRGILGRTVLLPNLLFAVTAALDAASALRHGASSPLLVGAAVGFGAIAVALGSRLFAPTVAGPADTSSSPAGKA